MTDFHTHILPMMDDGAASVEEALAMLRLLAAQGVDTVYLTPHFYIDQNHVEEFLERRGAAFEMLEEGIGSSDEPAGDAGKPHSQDAKSGLTKIPTLKLGAEVFYFEGMSTEENIAKLKALKLEDTDYLLLEMPFTKWTKRMVEDILTLQSQPDIKVLMAHIDRYLDFTDMETLFYLKRMGVAFQMNAEYIKEGLFHRKAKKLLGTGLISVIASDAHNMGDRRPNLELVARLG